MRGEGVRAGRVSGRGRTALGDGGARGAAGGGGAGTAGPGGWEVWGASISASRSLPPLGLEPY